MGMEAMGLDPSAAHVRSEWRHDQSPGATPGAKAKVRIDLGRAESLAEVLISAELVKVEPERSTGKGDK